MATDDRARKRTIITGGTGLIGWALAAELVTRGHEVMVLSRSPGRVGGLPKGVRAERWEDVVLRAEDRLSRARRPSSTWPARTWPRDAGPASGSR